MSNYAVKIFSRFERFWHWSQMVLIMTLIFSGFRIHGFYQVISFDLAVKLHTFAALALLVIWMFAVFWLFTTGDWKQYLPTKKGLFRVARYYAYGIFKNEAHPYKKTYLRKHNPLQALSYLALKIFLFPAIWMSGLIYLTYGFWGEEVMSSTSMLMFVAIIHTAAAFAIVAFVIIHVYLLTTGHGFVVHVKPMITGFDKVELTDEEIAFLQSNEPKNIRKE
ncbi:MAG: cytochrome b/b6 domain-containing protein [Gammaproteobacteria bacterium]|jgi:thiosulfate reductase cytochrome b subunit